MPKFLRRVWHRHVKIGKGRKKKQVWRKPKGRDNKMREKRRGRPAVVSIGYKKANSEAKKIFVANNIKDLIKAGKNKKIVIGNVGMKKKIEMAKKAEEIKTPISNLNVKKFLKQTHHDNAKLNKKIEEKEK